MKGYLTSISWRKRKFLGLNGAKYRSVSTERQDTRRNLKKSDILGEITKVDF